ncbi:MAG TPA: L,D-transpeptidase family protein [Pyrinomonadaceae bacterium]|nr:L,D-transpeptidase family protein [Pyrinomonadaceae bacterium]
MKVLLTTYLFLLAASSMATSQKTAAAPLRRVQVKEAEQRLADLGYWTGPVDGRFDSATRAALISFQKWEGRTITGRLTTEELEALRGGATPVARDGSYEHVEIDVDRQVLLLVDDKGSVRVLPVSTGTDKPFSYDGQTSIAYTPRGRFVVYEKGVGWEDNLPGMYYANYISGGIAIHGSYDVPPQPASHGCIRIPIFAAREVSKRLKLGTIVLVYDKVSFVSARSWVENPKLKEAALANSALN